MTKSPDKWIRKAFETLIVDNNISTVWDMNVTGDVYPDEYILLTTQTKTDNQLTKCGGQWDCSILLDIIKRYPSVGNTGSRLVVNDIEDEIIANIGSLSVDGFSLFNIQLESSTSFDNSDKDEMIYRQLMRYRIILGEL